MGDPRSGQPRTWPQAAEALDNTLDAAAGKQLTYPEMLAELLGVEVSARRECYLTTRTKLAHLAIALALKAIEHGHGAYFVRAYDLMEDLRKAQAEQNLGRRMRVYLAPKVLIVDEFGIWPYDRDAATAFFTLVSARYERGSIILTSTKGFGEWGELLGDTVIASAILDRLLHHSHVLNIRGESYRLREKRQAGLFSSHRSWATFPWLGPYSESPSRRSRRSPGSSTSAGSFSWSGRGKGWWRWVS